MNNFTFYTECKECKKKKKTVGTGKLNLKMLLFKLRNKTKFSVLAAQVLKETGELPESSFYADVQLSKEQGSPFM